MLELDISPDDDLLNNDWIRSARLLKRIEAGDEDAKREWEERENTKLVPWEGPTEND